MIILSFSVRLHITGERFFTGLRISDDRRDVRVSESGAYARPYDSNFA
jgi:hypothetical protein